MKKGIIIAIIIISILIVIGIGAILFINSAKQSQADMELLAHANAVKKEMQIDGFKESVGVTLLSIKTLYIHQEEWKKNPNISIDEYIFEQLSTDTEHKKMLEDYAAGAGFSVSVDKNIGIICTYKMDGSKLICKIKDGKDSWDN